MNKIVNTRTSAENTERRFLSDNRRQDVIIVTCEYIY